MGLQNTPQSQRLTISIFGKTNSGKSSLLNALTNQKIAVVSDIPGTTTDPVYKTMEINGIGPVLFIDTAGFDDTSILGKERIEKTQLALQKTDIALLLFSFSSFCENPDFSEEQNWIKMLNKKKTPIIPILNKIDVLESANVSKDEIAKLQNFIYELTDINPITISAKDRIGVDKIKQEIIRNIPEDFAQRTLTGNLCKENDSVLLVMPQDIQAPKGRLILPQVQVLRELLDKKCIVTSCTTDKIDQTLKLLNNKVDLIITDSQVYKTVYDKKPENAKLTSFSVLLAANKGDISQFVEGAKAIDTLTGNSRVLIAEACTHAPLAEDIGREKIPRMLRKIVEEKQAGWANQLKIDIVSGTDFPKDLSMYNLIIHCGACMFNRAYVLDRQARAKEQNVPMTNYGITIAKINNILDKIVLPC